ncbi:hypothetical protein OAE35_01885 [Synechococcus sp. AH-551-E02]|nr:hypothetical protein [Synechococcus sp. AH-551-E02]MDB4653633.1 hypothetical protein [Synechococcus sp. AH-551-E02]
MNAVAFVLLQNQLQLSIARDEAQIAFRETLARERASTDLILENYRHCIKKQQASCAGLAKNIVIRKSRLVDLTEFFKDYPFEVSSDHGLIKDIESTLTSIDIIAVRGFGLSFDEAHVKGIKNADDYSKHVETNKGDDLSKRIVKANIDKEIKQILNNVSFMSGWNSENIQESKIVEEKAENTWRSLIALIVFEIALFLLVSTSDFWLTNVPTKSESTLHSRLFKTRSAIPMVGVVIFGFCAVITSQRIVYIELERTVLEGCRRINRNSIFVFNQTQDPSRMGFELEKNDLTLPSYCIKSIDESINGDKKNDEDAREIILSNAENISRLQTQKSNESGNLALSLLIFNTFAMAFDAIKLDYQSMDVDED